jgi:hypothetical protein
MTRMAQTCTCTWSTGNTATGTSPYITKLDLSCPLHSEQTVSVLSQAVERVREQLRHERDLVRDDVAKMVEDYDAIADVYQRITRETWENNE